MKEDRRLRPGSVLLFLLCFALLLPLTACGSLSESRALNKEELRNYADAKGRYFFSEESWDIITDLVVSGQSQIDKAIGKSKIEQIVRETKAAIDQIAPEKYDFGCDGAYFVTDESYESYVREFAALHGEGEEWIEELLNGGTGGKWSQSIHRKSSLWCVIRGNQICVSSGNNTVYRFYPVQDGFKGETLHKSILFQTEGDLLTLTEDGKTLQYQKDPSYRETGETVILDPPEEIDISCGGEGLNFLILRWNFQYGYGMNGAGADIRTADSKTYETVRLEEVWEYAYVMQFQPSDFRPGENWVRLYSIGGPMITNQKTLYLEKTSPYVLFRVMVEQDGSIRVEQILSEDE